jgi:hypothetical protein
MPIRHSTAGEISRHRDGQAQCSPERKKSPAAGAQLSRRTHYRIKATLQLTRLITLSGKRKPHLPTPDIPGEAWNRRHDLTDGEWKLYVLYCSYRNDKTGRCDPSLKTLAEEMKRTYTHVSDLKRELILKGWIRRLGRNDVELLVGYLPPAVRPLEAARSSEKSEDEVRKYPNLVAPQSSEKSEVGTRSSEKSEDEVRKYPNENSLPPYPPIRNELLVAEAAAAAASADLLSMPADEEFVREVIASGLYRGEFVRWVWGKLKLYCMAGGSPPVRRQFLSWLSDETGSPPVQPTLPGVGAPLVEGSFGANGQPAVNPILREADPNCRLCGGEGESGGQSCPCRACQFCFGAGMELFKGKMRRCRCRLPPAESPPMTAEELRVQQERFDAAQAELRQANSS